MSIDWTDRKRCETPEELEEAIADMVAHAECSDDTSLPEVTAAMIELIKDGSLVDSGERCEGRICWKLNAKGMAEAHHARGEPCGYA